MPYYVNAVHTDSTINRQFGGFDNYDEAEACRREMQEGWREGDNYVVEIFYGKDQNEAEERIIAFRRERGLPFP